jgi:hypothetical protein
VLDRTARNAHHGEVIRYALLLALLAPLLPATAQAQASEAQAALWEQDLRLARVAERIMGANVRLCRQTMPVTGMILHSADQYGAQLPGAFAGGPVEVIQVVPGSAAASAGLRAGDALLAVGGTAIDEVEAAPGFPLRDAVFDLVASISGAIDLRYVRAGSIRTATLEPPAGCRALVEVLADEDSTARSDGRVIQLSYDLVTRLDDAGLAVVFAHELAHVVLEHRRRLSEAGVADGLARQFGRNRRLSRIAEVEADLLSVHLLANAGFDPVIAPQFWQSDAGRILGSGLVRSRIYPGRTERAAQMEQEIAQYLSGYDQLSAAGHLIALRDQPFAD